METLVVLQQRQTIAPAGEGQGNLKNNVICCRLTQYPKMLTRAFGARNKYPTIQSKTSQKHEMIRLRLRHAKNGHFCTVR